MLQGIEDGLLPLISSRDEFELGPGNSKLLMPAILPVHWHHDRVDSIQGSESFQAVLDHRFTG